MRIAAAVLVVLLTASPLAGAPPNWVRFRHPVYGFTISYPRGWEVLSGEGRAAFAAVGPPASGSPGARQVIVIVTLKAPPGATLDQAGAELEQVLARDARTTRVLRTDRISLRGIPALMTYLARTSPQGIELYQMAMILLYRDRGYAIAGTTAAGSPRLTEETRFLQSLILTFQPR